MQFSPDREGRRIAEARKDSGMQPITRPVTPNFIGNLFLVGYQERKKIDGSDIIAKKMGKLKVRSKEAVNVMELREIEPPLWSSSLVKHEKEIDVSRLHVTCPFFFFFLIVIPL